MEPHGNKYAASHHTQPMRSALSEVVGKNWALRVAVLATFIVSGLMHELIFYYVNGVSSSWEMTWFFVLHGLCVMVEIGLKRAVKDTWRLPSFVSGPLTVGFVVATAFGLFFPPIIRNGADERVNNNNSVCTHTLSLFLVERLFSNRPPISFLTTFRL